MYYIIVDETQAIGIGNESAKLILLFTEHTTKEVGESVCRFLNLQPTLPAAPDRACCPICHSPHTMPGIYCFECGTAYPPRG